MFFSLEQVTGVVYRARPVETLKQSEMAVPHLRAAPAAHATAIHTAGGSTSVAIQNAINTSLVIKARKALLESFDADAQSFFHSQHCRAARGSGRPRDGPVRLRMT